jgi:hypothetical protein
MARSGRARGSGDPVLAINASPYSRAPRRIFVGAVAALLAACACVAKAEERENVGSGASVAFHIPAQPLASALQAYGRMTGIQVLYESNSAVGQQSSAVDGNMAPDVALKALLAGTDLRVRYIQSDAITLASASAAPVAAIDVAPASGPQGPADLSLGTLRVRGANQVDTRLQDYGERLRTDIQNALRKNPRTRDGSYRVVLDIWIDPAQTVERTKVSRSTGNDDRDAAIATTLRGLTVSQPAPPSMPQPVRVAIVVRGLP